MEFFYWIILLVAAIAQILLIVAIFTIKDNAVKQTNILVEQSKILEYQNKILLANLNLTASIADKQGVPASDINDATLDFGFEFE